MRLSLFLSLICWSTIICAQSSLQIKTVNSSTGAPLSEVSIAINGKTIKATDVKGTATLRLQEGIANLRFTSVGYKAFDTSLSLLYKDTLQISLIEKEKYLEEVVVVASTRNNQRIENAPLKVEVLGHEEMDEESRITPSGVGSILGDISGVQIQQSSAISRNANIKIQGLDGRYTQILKDGMPLYDGFSGGFGILSIPPLDLKQIELIKGSASTLYGGDAIGGLVNIISQAPKLKQDAIIKYQSNHTKRN